MQSGRVTSASRGSEMPYASCRSAETCTSSVVSEPPPPDSPSIAQPSQERSSVPITRMFNGSFGPSTSSFSGRSVSMPLTSWERMSPSRCR